MLTRAVLVLWIVGAGFLCLCVWGFANQVLDDTSCERIVAQEALKPEPTSSNLDALLAARAANEPLQAPRRSRFAIAECRSETWLIGSVTGAFWLITWTLCYVLRGRFWRPPRPSPV